MARCQGVDEHAAETERREQHQRRIARAGEPAARHEGVEERVVRVLREILVELQRPDAERLVEREVGAEDVPAETAVRGPRRSSARGWRAA